MTHVSKLIFTTGDYIKGGTLIFSLMVMYFNLVNEIKENKIVNNADKVIINFRLSAIEEAIKINKPVMGVATIPQQPERKNEDE